MLLSIVAVVVVSVAVSAVAGCVTLFVVAWLTRKYRQRQADRIVDRFLRGLEASTSEMVRRQDIAGMLSIMQRIQEDVRTYLAAKNAEDRADERESQPASEGHF